MPKGAELRKRAIPSLILFVLLDSERVRHVPNDQHRIDNLVMKYDERVSA